MSKQLHTGLFFNNFVLDFNHFIFTGNSIMALLSDLPVVLFCSHFYVLYEVNSTVSFSVAFDVFDECYPKYRIRRTYF